MLAFTMLARGTVLVSLLGAAIWKLTHRSEFHTAVAEVLGVDRRRTARVLSMLVPFVELGVGIGVVIPGDVAVAAAAAAIVLFGSFSIVLLRIPDGSACGCWRETSFVEPPGLRKKTSLVRNAILLLLAVFALMRDPLFGYNYLAFGLVAGGLLALILMELPNLAAIALTTKPAAIGTPL